MIYNAASSLGPDRESILHRIESSSTPCCNGKRQRGDEKLNKLSNRKIVPSRNNRAQWVTNGNVREFCTATLHFAKRFRRGRLA